ncbi:MAG TPA: hypothetical protein P5191_17260, partial [Ruminococcus sp.]|nr:hypothetical protein [Ruminococcus sp.]
GTEGTTLYLPAELHAGAVKMAVFGYDTESDTTVRATTVPVTLNIRESGFEGDEPPIPPTPDLYTQLLKRIEDAEHGLDGKSAYEIAIEHGYVGTEEEWLASLHGKDGITPDMSEYPKASEVQTIVEQEIAPVAEESHTHDNKATLDSITPELFSDLSGLQQFEDRTQYEIQTLNEAVENLRPSTHTHNNKAVLDRITEAMIDAIAEYPPFEDWTREQIHTLFEMVNNFSNTAHTHENKVTLDALTPELFSDLAGLQQFEDSTQYDIQTINEALLTLNAQRHTHDNKAVLDTITEQYMRDQAAFQASTAGALHGLSTGLSEVSAQAHSHANKAVLDGITQEMLDDMASIATVIGQAHWHHNLTTLNSITESHVSRWNEAYTAAMNLNERVGVNEGVFERFKTEILYDMQGAKTSISDILSRLSAVEEALSGVETALADIVEVSE